MEKTGNLRCEDYLNYRAHSLTGFQEGGRVGYNCIGLVVEATKVVKIQDISLFRILYSKFTRQKWYDDKC